MGFGVVGADPFGFADSDRILQGVTEAGNVGGKADALNAEGDKACSTVWGEYQEPQATYRLINGAEENFSGIKLGQHEGDFMIASVGVDTDNQNYPLITIGGRTKRGAAADAEYDLTDMGPILGIKVAQPIGFTSDDLVQSSSVNAAFDTTAVVHGPDGDEAAIGVGGATLTASGEVKKCTGDPTAAAAAGWTLESPNDSDKQNTDYGSLTINVFKNLLREVPAP